MEEFLTGENDWLWDEAEYNFFMSLSDMAKLEYMYDYFNLDFSEFESQPTLTVELEDEELPPRTEVVITDTHMMITCSDPRVFEVTLTMFCMDGWVLRFDKKKGDTTFYKIVGKTDPISVN